MSVDSGLNWREEALEDEIERLRQLDRDRSRVDADLRAENERLREANRKLSRLIVEQERKYAKELAFLPGSSRERA